MFDMPMKDHKIVPDDFESLLTTPDCDNDATKNLLTLFNANTESMALSRESESGKIKHNRGKVTRSHIINATLKQNMFIIC